MPRGGGVQLTGRKGRVVKTDRGDIVYEARGRDEPSVSNDRLNIAEKQHFMDGDKVSQDLG